MNQYEAAIYQVGHILEAYDYDKSFPVFGFGGIPLFMGAQQVMHCFPLNGVNENPEVHYVQGILDLYRNTLPNIKLSGPTKFSGILEAFVNHVEQ